MSQILLSQKSDIATPSKLLRLGEINFINCLPINLAFKRYCETNDNQFELINSYPSDLNLKLRSGELDIAPISSYEYLTNPDSYQILEGLSISSSQQADSVLLFVRGAIGSLYLANKIYITNKSATSVNLLKIILVKNYGFHIREGLFFNSNGDQVEFVEFADNDPGYDIKLLIGDEALLEDKSKYEMVIDLGNEWFNISHGLPMVFGLWTMSTASAWINSIAQIQEFFVDLKEQGLNEYFPDVVIEAYGKTGLTKTVLKKYFANLDYGFSDKHQVSLNLFKCYLVELGLA